jgi:hypothetical protein
MKKPWKVKYWNTDADMPSSRRFEAVDAAITFKAKMQAKGYRNVQLRFIGTNGKEIHM